MSFSSTFVRRVLAVFIVLLFGLMVLLANAARIAESPLAGAGSGARLGGIGPGALGQLRFELGKLGTSKPQLERAMAERALASMPLSSEPFTALATLGLIDDPRGKTGKEEILLSEALQRDPRSRAARILLLRNYAAKGELKPAFDQLARLSVLSPGLVEQVMEAITGRIENARQVDQALAAIDGHEGLYLPFVNRMAGKKKSPEVALRLAERLPAKILARPSVRRGVVLQLIGAGEIPAARRIWQQGLGKPASGLVHSPDFSDRSAPPPFNWLLAVNNSGAVERSKQGGLTIVYYDRAPGPLISQLLTLAPGNYDLRIDYNLVRGSANNLRLQIACEGATTLLAEVPLTQPRAGAQALKTRFSVPSAACRGQRIAIAGVATEQRGETQVSVQRIDIATSGNSQ